MWKEAWFMGIPNNLIIVILLFLSSQGTVVGHFLNIFKHGVAPKVLLEKIRFFYLICFTLLGATLIFGPTIIRWDFYTFGFMAAKITVALK